MGGLAAGKLGKDIREDLLSEKWRTRKVRRQTAAEEAGFAELCPG
jgi:hypothetical protein